MKELFVNAMKNIAWSSWSRWQRPDMTMEQRKGELNMDMFMKIVTSDLFYAMIIYIVFNVLMIAFFWLVKEANPSWRGQEKQEKFLKAYVIVASVVLFLLIAAFLQDIGVLDIEIIQMMKKLRTNPLVGDLLGVIINALPLYFLLSFGIYVYRVSSWKAFSSIDEDALGKIKLVGSFLYWGFILTLFILYETAHMTV